MRYLYLFTFLLSFLLAPSLDAQQRYTQKEIDGQHKFLEAKKELLVGRLDKASVLFHDILLQNKANHAAAYELARIYDKQDEPAKSLKYAEQAVAMDASNEWYQIFLAEAYTNAGKSKDAATQYESLVKKYPNKDVYYMQWAYSLIQLKQPEKALKAYQKLEDRFGVSEDLIHKKHTLYALIGDKKKAANEIKKLVSKFPKNTRYKHLLAEFYSKNNEMDKAEKLYNDILEIDPNDGEAIMAIADKIKNKGDDASYLSSIESVFADKETDIDLKIEKLYPYIKEMEQSKDPKVIENTKNLASILCKAHPEDAKAFSIYGDILSHSGDLEGAKEQFEKTLELDNTKFSVWEQMMYISEAQGDMDQLLKTTNEAMDLFPNKARAYYFNGIAHGAKKDHEQAVKSFEQAFIMSRKDRVLNLDIQMRIGREYFFLKKYEKAAKLYEKSVKEGGDKHPILLEVYGDVLYQLGKQTEAVEMWQKSEKLGNKTAELKKKLSTKQL